MQRTTSADKKTASYAKKYFSAIEKRPRAARREVLVIGDLHGELDGTLEILSHAGILDARAHWKGGTRVLVQMGDIVDRGPASLAVYKLISRLEREAAHCGGLVVRLLGNHELELLRGGAITTLGADEAQTLRALVTRDILDNKIKAAYYAQGYLFTHAGFTMEMLKRVYADFDGAAPSPAKLAAHLNALLAEAVRSGDYSHPIFRIGASRGGQYKHGGIFWEDIREVFNAQDVLPLRQIIAHTPISRILFSGTGNIVAVDVGIYAGYGGGRGYLRLAGGKPEAVEFQ